LETATVNIKQEKPQAAANKKKKHNAFADKSFLDRF